jgi:hypothetical protein
VAGFFEISHNLWRRKALFSPYKVRFIPFDALRGKSGEKLYRVLKHLGHQGSDLRALRSGQGDVSKEWMALERFDHGDDAIVATDPKVVSLGDIVGKDDSRALADARQDGEENSAF